MFTPEEAAPALSFLRCLSARAGAQRWTRREWAWAHAKARAEWRRNIAEGIAAAGATAFVAKRAGSVGA